MEKFFKLTDHPRLLATESHRLALANAAIFHNVIGKMLCVESCVKAFMYLKLQTGVGGRKKRKINQVYRIIAAFPFFLLLNPIWFLSKRSTIRPPLSDRRTSWRVPRRTSKRRKSPWRESLCRRSRPSAARRLRNSARTKSPKSSRCWRERLETENLSRSAYKDWRGFSIFTCQLYKRNQFTCESEETKTVASKHSKP